MIVMVLGPQRSGSSLLAGMLHKLGINMGQRLLGPMQTNPLGHFEDLDFLMLNKRILRRAGGSYHNPPDRQVIAAIRDYDEEIKQLVADRRQFKDWGWKDPRTVLTFPVYFRLLDQFKAVIILRSFHSMALSLKARDKTDYQKSWELTMDYAQRLFSYIAVLEDYYSLSYEAIIDQPRKQLEQLTAYLEITPQASQIEEALDFVRSDLKHF